jgi:YVTN family beta-propeller protein
VSWLDLTNPLLPVVLATVTVGVGPYGVAISPDGTRALVPNYGSANVSWLDLTNPLLPVVLATVTVGVHPIGVAISPDGTRALVANYSSNDVSWLDLTNPLLPVVLATVTVGTGPYGVAISPTASADVFGDFVRCLTYVSSTPITGASSDWLSALGNERGCIRQDGEDGEAYRARVRMIPDAVSPLAIARAVDATATALPERWLAEPFNDGADPNVKLAANLGFFDGFFCDSDFCDDPLGVSLADKQPVANLECSGIRESRAYVRVDLVGQLQEPDGLVLYCDDGFCDDPQWGYPDVHTHPVIQGAEQALLQQMQLKVAGGVNFDVYLENSETLVQQGTLSGTTSAGGTPVITLTPVAGTAWYLREGLLTADMGNRHWAVTGQGIAVRLTLDDGTTLQTPWAQGVVSLRSYELEALGYRGQRVTSIECLGLTLYDLEPPYSMNLIGSFTVNTATL